MTSGARMRDPAATRRGWADEANGGAPEGARLIYEEAHPFGGDLVHRWRLGNGLTILVLVDASAPIVTYQTWFKVGSRHEHPGKTGLAHLFEHLMFNETENLRAGMFDRKLEESGAETNAATFLDWASRCARTTSASTASGLSSNIPKAALNCLARSAF